MAGRDCSSCIPVPLVVGLPISHLWGQRQVSVDDAIATSCAPRRRAGGSWTWRGPRCGATLEPGPGVVASTFTSRHTSLLDIGSGSFSILRVRHSLDRCAFMIYKSCHGAHAPDLLRRAAPRSIGAVTRANSGAMTSVDGGATCVPSASGRGHRRQSRGRPTARMPHRLRHTPITECATPRYIFESARSPAACPWPCPPAHATRPQ